MIKRRKGFTLIELLVVIAIIAILAAILFPVFSRAREQARKTACLSNMKQIGIGLMMYAQDWDETLPFWREPCHGDPNYLPGGLMWTEQIMPYVKNIEVFRCPSAQQEWQWAANCYPEKYGRPQNNMRCNYGYHSLIANGGLLAVGASPPLPGCATGCHKLARLTAPAETLVIADSVFTFIAPWSRIYPQWMHMQPALANYNWNGDVACGCPGRLTVPLEVALDRHARHSQGAIIVFADGHAKWYRGDQIVSRWHGGSLRICGPDLAR